MADKKLKELLKKMIVAKRPKSELSDEDLMKDEPGLLKGVDLSKLKEKAEAHKQKVKDGMRDEENIKRREDYEKNSPEAKKKAKRRALEYLSKL